ncbi:zinc finger MYM-type protein 5-like [Schistocerca piceifrons]|uniref:zinc finger MYM-type protein 5-like n=1 Tax=Schistocerca piceifrons TaxID=274613 RepID=UPI001F5F47E2|nr:zinc finger MYM-type protein 5-like [Schistocerca piceifrons]
MPEEKEMVKKKLSGSENRKRKAEKEKVLEETEKHMNIYKFPKGNSKANTSDIESKVHVSANISSDCEQLYTKNIQSPIEGDQIDQRSTSLHESSDISPSQNQHMTSVVDESINVLAIKEYNVSDVGTWPKVLNARDIDRIIICGPSQVCLNNFPKDENGCHFSSTHYTRKLSNEETIRQRWLVYSVSNDSVFCFCCRLFDL